MVRIKAQHAHHIMHVPYMNHAAYVNHLDSNMLGMSRIEEEDAVRKEPERRRDRDVSALKARPNLSLSIMASTTEIE